MFITMTVCAFYSMCHCMCHTNHVDTVMRTITQTVTIIMCTMARAQYYKNPIFVIMYIGVFA